jgi:hypothetical protein
VLLFWLNSKEGRKHMKNPKFVYLFEEAEGTNRSSSEAKEQALPR